MQMKRIINISIVVLAIAFTGGCSKNPRIAVSLDADRGTNVTTVTTNGTTLFLGTTVLNTNASAGRRSSP